MAPARPTSVSDVSRSLQSWASTTHRSYSHLWRFSFSFSKKICIPAPAWVKPYTSTKMCDDVSWQQQQYHQIHNCVVLLLLLHVPYWGVAFSYIFTPKYTGEPRRGGHRRWSRCWFTGHQGFDLGIEYVGGGTIYIWHASCPCRKWLRQRVSCSEGWFQLKRFLRSYNITGGVVKYRSVTYSAVGKAPLLACSTPSPLPSGTARDVGDVRRIVALTHARHLLRRIWMYVRAYRI